MKPDAPNAPPTGSAPPGGLTGNETQVIDLSEVEVLVAQHNLESQRQLEAHGPMPPPLPASELARASMSMAPPDLAARSNVFYVVAILAFLVIGIGGGLVIAKTLSKPAPAPPEPIHVAASHAPPTGGAAVITIPTVEMNDTDASTK